jgi:hypothetical protein
MLNPLASLLSPLSRYAIMMSLVLFICLSLYMKGRWDAQSACETKHLSQSLRLWEEGYQAREHQRLLLHDPERLRQPDEFLRRDESDLRRAPAP